MPPFQLIIVTAFEMRHLRWMKVYRWTFKCAIRLPLVKLINKGLEPLAAHLKLLDPPLQACYRVIDRIHTSLPFTS